MYNSAEMYKRSLFKAEHDGLLNFTQAPFQMTHILLCAHNTEGEGHMETASAFIQYR